MLELIAIGTTPEQRCTVRLQPGRPLEIGRGTQAGLAIPWEPHLSQLHLTLLADDSDKVRLEIAEGTPNPVFVAGEPVTSSDLASGDFFVVGQTSFHLGHGTDSHSASDHPE